MSIRVKFRLERGKLSGMSVGLAPHMAEGELGGEPGYPNLILVKRDGLPDLLCTLEGVPVAVMERGKAK